MELTNLVNELQESFWWMSLDRDVYAMDSCIISDFRFKAFRNKSSHDSRLVHVASRAAAGYLTYIHTYILHKQCMNTLDIYIS